MREPEAGGGPCGAVRRVIPDDLRNAGQSRGIAIGQEVREVSVMARIEGADPSKQGLFQGLFTRVVYSLTKRKVGRTVLPVRIAAHHAKLLWGYAQMEQSLLGSRLVEEPLKNLGELRVATLVGCPF
jgi:hypothetical protein